MKTTGENMSQPIATENWNQEWNDKKEKVTGGLGVTMSPDQFNLLTSHIDKVLGETTRREQAVAESLLELKKIESVRTYAAFVKDITTSIQTLSQLNGTEKAVGQLLDTLSDFNSKYKTLGDSGEDMESRPSLHTQTNP